MRDIINKDEVNMLEDVFGDLFRPYDRRAMSMKTDIKEDEKQYELDVEMPGFKKEEINIDLNDGYLTINAKREDRHEEGNEHSKKFVRRERSYSASRSYYVGDKIKENDIKAKYENGVLSLIVPKEEPKKLPEHKIHID